MKVRKLGIDMIDPSQYTVADDGGHAVAAEASCVRPWRVSTKNERGFRFGEFRVGCAGSRARLFQQKKRPHEHGLTMRRLDVAQQSFGLPARFKT